RQLQEARDSHGQIENRLAALSARRREIDQARTSLERTAADQGRAIQTVTLSLAELRQRQHKLQEDLRTLEQTPPPKNLLRYQTPVSRPVNTEEFMFECREGRVTFIELTALQGEIRRDLDAKGQLLKTRWQVSDATAPVGAFRLRYTVERE